MKSVGKESSYALFFPLANGRLYTLGKVDPRLDTFAGTVAVLARSAARQARMREELQNRLPLKNIRALTGSSCSEARNVLAWPASFARGAKVTPPAPNFHRGVALRISPQEFCRAFGRRRSSVQGSGPPAPPPGGSEAGRTRAGQRRMTGRTA